MSQFSTPDGAWPILLTAFDNNDELDLPAVGALLDFYDDLGIRGLLALGQASEVILLSHAERLRLAEFVAARPRKSLAIAAVGNFGASMSEQARSLQQIHDWGADVVVVGLSLLPSADDLGGQLLELAQLIEPATHLGIYELPEPEHRLLTPDEVAAAAGTGRYVFMKDTCRQLETFRAKVAAAAGSSLKIYQANLQVLPESMLAGGRGFCGWMPIVAPELCAQVCDLTLPQKLRDAAQNKLLDFYAVMVAHGFPASAKHILAKRSLPIAPYSRAPAAQAFFQRDTAELDDYIARENPFAAISADSLA